MNFSEDINIKILIVFISSWILTFNLYADENSSGNEILDQQQEKGINTEKTIEEPKNETNKETIKETDNETNNETVKETVKETDNETNKETVKETVKETDKESSKKDEKAFNSFYLDSEFRYFTISGTDQNYNVSQNLVFRAASLEEVGFMQNWNQDFRSYFGMNYSVLQVSNSDAGITVNNTIKREINFVVAAKYRLLPFAYLQGEYTYGGIMVFRAINPQSVKIESILISRFYFTGGFTFIDYKSFGVHAEGIYDFVLPYSDSNYKSVNGNGFETALLFTYQGNEWAIKSRFYYNLFRLNTYPINLQYQEYGVSLGVVLDL